MKGHATHASSKSAHPSKSASASKSTTKTAKGKTAKAKTSTHHASSSNARVASARSSEAAYRNKLRQCVQQPTEQREACLDRVIEETQRS
jgi:hypothetical protein